MNVISVIERLGIPEPAASRRTLRIVAGSLWIIAGTILVARAVPWLLQAGNAGWIAGACGLLLGFVKSRLVFVPFAARNIERIRLLSPHKGKVCVFAFQAVESYLLILFMIAAGILLRYSSLPRLLLAGIYVTVGFALLLAGPRYLRANSAKMS